MSVSAELENPDHSKIHGGDRGSCVTLYRVLLEGRIPDFCHQACCCCVTTGMSNLAGHAGEESIILLSSPPCLADTDMTVVVLTNTVTPNRTASYSKVVPQLTVSASISGFHHACTVDATAV